MGRALFILYVSSTNLLQPLDDLLGNIADIKLSNVLVNYGHSENRFSDVHLADLASTVRMYSPYVRNGESIGTPISRSPEAQLQVRWGTATDIWSFGAM